MSLAPPISLWALLPQIVLMGGACLVLLVGLGTSRAARRAVPWLSLGSVVLALLGALVVFNPDLAERLGLPFLSAGGGVGNGLAHTNLAIYMLKGTLTLGVLIILATWTAARESENGEFFAMLLCTLTGLLLVGPADNLVILFLALELVSVPTYVMVVLSRLNPRSVEAGTKYFYLGAFSAAIMAYGFSLLYGVAGTAALPEAVRAIGTALRSPGELSFLLALAGVLLSVGGLLFKLAAFPLHLYVADVYHGASSAVAGMLGFVPKFAGVVALCKLVAATGFWEAWAVAADSAGAALGELVTSIGTGHVATFWLLWLVAALSMTIGNLLALMQYNVKRMLAYSGVAHAGYILVGVLAGPGESVWRDGTAAALFYVVVYGLANLGAFVILALLRVRGEPCETRRDLAGLLGRHPGLALLMALAMFTLMGMPPTPGFWGKLTLFGSALSAAQEANPHYGWWLVVLVVVAVVNSAIAAAYYLSVIASVLLYESDRPAEAVERDAPQISALLCGLLTLIFAVHPALLLNVGRVATSEFRGIHVSQAGSAQPARPSELAVSSEFGRPPAPSRSTPASTPLAEAPARTDRDIAAVPAHRRPGEEISASRSEPGLGAGGRAN